jgi:type IV pilus assembly protein PilV
VARDKCEWSNALKGAAEKTGSSLIGAMIGARGCIEQLQLRDISVGVCKPGVYRVTVVWQGLNPTAAPSLTCASAFSYGSTTALRRAIATNVTLGLPSCS